MGHFITSNSKLGPILPVMFSQYWSGVDLFFVISGFVIFLSLYRLRAAASGSWEFSVAYSSFRFWRIVPIYLLLIASFLLIPMFYRPPAESNPFASSIPHWCYFIFAQSVWAVVYQHRGADFVNVTWSLCAEVGFYGVAFLVVLLFPARARIRILLALVAVSYLARVAFVFIRNDLAAAYIFPACRMDGFMLGGIAAILYVEKRLTARFRKMLNWILVGLTPIYCLLAYLCQLQSTMFSVFFSYTFYALFYCLLVIWASFGEKAPLERGPLAYFGKVSYFVYLFQVPALWLTEIFFPGALGRFVGTLFLVVGLASLSWFCFERPLIRFGRSLLGTRIGGIPT